MLLLLLLVLVLLQPEVQKTSKHPEPLLLLQQLQSVWSAAHHLHMHHPQHQLGDHSSLPSPAAAHLT
jgi:hypothetical protein